MKKILLRAFIGQILFSVGAMAQQADTLQATKDTTIEGVVYHTVEYFDNGNVSAIGNYGENNIKVGKWWYYKADGSLKMSGAYVNGRKDGPWLITPYTLEIYQNGQLKQKKTINAGSTY